MSTTNSQTILGYYEIGELLDMGAQGVVYRGVDLYSGQQVVIKELTAGDPPDSEALARFQRAAALRIGHPNILDPIDAGEEGGKHYTIFPFVDGRRLDDLVRDYGNGLPLRAVVAIVLGILRGLIALCNKRIVHRDLKPGNILVLPDWQPVIIDLGICRLLDEPTLAPGQQTIGTFKYMPPEQKEDSRNAVPASDVFALALILRLMLTGLEPDPDACAQASLRHIDSSIPEWLDDLFLAMADSNPDGRPTAHHLYEVLGRRSDALASDRCIHCQCSLPQNARFCPECGAPRDGQNSPQNDRRAHCIACGSLMDSGSACPACRRQLSPANHRLVFKTGPVEKGFRIPQGTYTVGRPQIAPENTFISRRQCQFICSNGSVFVQDAGGANPTRVDGRRADTPIQLRSGQHVLIGGFLAVYTSDH